MRLGNMLLWDIRFQVKYGFYLLYAALTALYVVILLAFPENWVDNVAAILIFSDPAAMGLYFMGAIVLLEKSQRVTCAFAVSPVSGTEYIISKVASLSIISIAVAAVLAIAAGANDFQLVLLGTAVTSAIFTLLGIVAATQITSLNQFILWTVPIMIISFVPAVLQSLGLAPAWLRHYPANACMDMIDGNVPSVIGALLTAALVGALFCVARRCVLKMWKGTGGAKL